MAKQKQTSGAQELNKILSDMNAGGDFPISILTDDQGLTIASAAGPGMDADRQSAVVAFMQKAMLQVSRQLGLEEVIEITMRVADGQRLVCRTFQIGSNSLILSVLVTAGQNRYRRLTSRVITRISHIWADYWE